MIKTIKKIIEMKMIKIYKLYNKKQKKLMIKTKKNMKI